MTTTRSRQKNISQETHAHNKHLIANLISKLENIRTEDLIEYHQLKKQFDFPPFEDLPYAWLSPLFDNCYFPLTAPKRIYDLAVAIDHCSNIEAGDINDAPIVISQSLNTYKRSHQKKLLTKLYQLLFIANDNSEFSSSLAMYIQSFTCALWPKGDDEYHHTNNSLVILWRDYIKRKRKKFEIDAEKFIRRNITTHPAKPLEEHELISLALRQLLHYLIYLLEQITEDELESLKHLREELNSSLDTLDDDEYEVRFSQIQEMSNHPQTSPNIKNVLITLKEIDNLFAHIPSEPGNSPCDHRLSILCKHLDPERISSEAKTNLEQLMQITGKMSHDNLRCANLFGAMEYIFNPSDAKQAHQHRKYHQRENNKTLMRETTKDGFITGLFVGAAAGAVFGTLAALGTIALSGPLAPVAVLPAVAIIAITTVVGAIGGGVIGALVGIVSSSIMILTQEKKQKVVNKTLENHAKPLPRSTTAKSFKALHDDRYLLPPNLSSDSSDSEEDDFRHSASPNSNPTSTPELILSTPQITPTTPPHSPSQRSLT